MDGWEEAVSALISLDKKKEWLARLLMRGLQLLILLSAAPWTDAMVRGLFTAAAFF